MYTYPVLDYTEGKQDWLKCQLSIDGGLVLGFVEITTCFCQVEDFSFFSGEVVYSNCYRFFWGVVQ